MAIRGVPPAVFTVTASPESGREVETLPGDIRSICRHRSGYHDGCRVLDGVSLIARMRGYQCVAICIGDRAAGGIQIEPQGAIAGDAVDRHRVNATAHCRYSCNSARHRAGAIHREVGGIGRV